MNFNELDAAMTAVNLAIRNLLMNGHVPTRHAARELAYNFGKRISTKNDIDDALGTVNWLRLSELLVTKRKKANRTPPPAA